MVVRSVTPIEAKATTSGSLWLVAAGHVLSSARTVPYEVVAPSPGGVRVGLHTAPRWLRVVAAIVFVLLVAGGIGHPVIGSFARSAPDRVRWTPRPLPAGSLTRLDPVAPVARAGWPRSSRPAGGILFVRCTSVWRAAPDGSEARRIVRVRGAGSPVFSPSARTIAFIKDGREIWMAEADGSDARKVVQLPLGALATPAYATKLAWSERGDKLAFALLDPTADLWTGGSSVWVLTLATGEFRRAGNGWPVPSYGDAGLVFAGRRSLNGAGQLERRLGNRGRPRALAFRPGSWTGPYRNGLALLRPGADGELELAVRRRTYDRRDDAVVSAPAGYRFADRARPAISQDGAAVYVELVGRTGEPSIGRLDVRRRAWQVIGYAWDPATTPAPTLTGKLTRARAWDAAHDLLSNWRWRPYKAAVLLGRTPARSLLPSREVQWLLGPAQRSGEGFVVTATVFGPHRGGFAYRDLQILVGERDGRIVASPVARSPIATVDTVAEAVGVLDRVLATDVAPPSVLPPGTELDGHALGGFSWDGGSTGSINLRTPATGSGGEPGAGGDGEHFVTLSYGDEVGFNLGCGEINDPEPSTVAGQPALIDRLGRANQVIWPATKDDMTTARFSVYTDLPREQMMRIAHGVEASR